MNLPDLLQTERDAIVPVITYQPSEDFDDDPDSIRWRAWWEKSYDGKVLGVSVQCYPVVKVTEQGAWIDPYAFREGWGENRSWTEPVKALTRWVSNDGGAAWAKPTKQIAIDSLLYRHKRWASKILNDICYFMDATKTMAILFPDRQIQADRSINALRFTAEKGIR